MTDIEEQALALVNEVAAKRGTLWPCIDRENDSRWEALCRFIEQHEAFRQEVSDAVESLCNTVFVYEEYLDMRDMLRRRFIIAKPDPLVEVLNDMKDGRAGPTTESYAACLRAAIEKRGGKIVWGEG